MTDVSSDDPIAAPFRRGPKRRKSLSGAPLRGAFSWLGLPYRRAGTLGRVLLLCLAVAAVADPLFVIGPPLFLMTWLILLVAAWFGDRSRPPTVKGVPREKQIAKTVVALMIVVFVLLVILMMSNVGDGGAAMVFFFVIAMKGLFGFMLAETLGIMPTRGAETEPSRRSHGSARFLDQLEPLLGEDGLMIGRASPALSESYAGRILSNPDPRHMVTVAANGAGKGVSAIVPNLLAYEGSVLAIDPKGELAAITSRRRAARGQTVHVLDPFGVSGLRSAAFNPLSLLNEENEDIVEDAALLTDALVYDERGSGDPYWGLEARNLLQGLILHIATSSDFDNDERHLLTLRRLITGDQEDFHATLQRGATNPHCAGSVARLLAPYSAMPEKQFGAVRSTARVSTDFLESARMARVLTTTDFELADLKRRPTTVYLCLPAARLGTHNSWLRLMIGLSLQAMERERVRPERPVVFLLDEFATLGYMRLIENAVGQIRGFGVQLWPVLQDLNQLKSLYQDRWETFLGNAGTVQFFGVNDQFTAQYISRLLGEETIVVTSETQAANRDPSVTVSERGRALLTPDEVRRLPSDHQIVVMQGLPALVAQKLRYYDDPEFEDLFDDNPLLE